MSHVAIGATVHYSKGDGYRKTRCVPAMVTRSDDLGKLWLTVFHHNQSPTRHLVDYSAEKELGTWHWECPLHEQG